MATVRIDQQMAGVAAAALPKKIEKELWTRYRQLPVLLRTAGLAAGYAYLVAKTDPKTDVGAAYGAVAECIRRRLVDRRLATGATPLDLLDSLAQLSGADFAMASAEARALAGWLSRLAEARYKAGAGGDSTPEPAPVAIRPPEPEPEP